MEKGKGTNSQLPLKQRKMENGRWEETCLFC